jgi:Holliday junction resolvase RusA-like endonuclease
MALRNKITFVVLGKPYGQKRPRARRIGKFISVYSPPENVEYKKKVIHAYNSVKTPDTYSESPTKVKITAFFNKPKITKKQESLGLTKDKYPCKKPDSDNIAKSILDALNGVAFYDDSYVIDLQVIKMYDEAEERVMVEIWEL